jgi:hypothetical protein
MTPPIVLSWDGNVTLSLTGIVATDLLPGRYGILAIPVLGGGSRASRCRMSVMEGSEDSEGYEGYERQGRGTCRASAAVATGRTWMSYVSLAAANAWASIVDHGRSRTTIECPRCFVMRRDDPFGARQDEHHTRYVRARLAGHARPRRGSQRRGAVQVNLLSHTEGRRLTDHS